MRNVPGRHRLAAIKRRLAALLHGSRTGRADDDNAPAEGIPDPVFHFLIDGETLLRKRK